MHCWHSVSLMQHLAEEGSGSMLCRGYLQQEHSLSEAALFACLG